MSSRARAWMEGRSGRARSGTAFTWWRAGVGEESGDYRRACAETGRGRGSRLPRPVAPCDHARASMQQLPRGRDRFAGAEGATAPETLRQKDLSADTI